MSLTTTVKRAPRWAWYVAGGVGLGAVAIEVYKRRAVDTTNQGDASSGGDVVGSPTGTTAPSPVITPPVIVTPDSGNQPDFTGMFAVFGDALNNAIGVVGNLAQGDQGITQTTVGAFGQLAGGAQDIARQALANAGQAPAPAAVNPTPIIVTVPTPATPAVVPAATPAARCSGEFPLYSQSRGACYKECSHCESCSKGDAGCGSNKKRRNNGNCYANGTRVNTSFTPTC